MSSVELYAINNFATLSAYNEESLWNLETQHRLAEHGIEVDGHVIAPEAWRLRLDYRAKQVSVSQAKK